MKDSLVTLKPHLAGLLHSIRLRLSLWFSLVLALILVLFSAFVYYRQTQDVRESSVARLLVRQRDLYGALVAASREQNTGTSWPPDSSVDFDLEYEEVFFLTDPAGQVSGMWGRIIIDQAEQVSAKMKALPPNRDSVRAISFRMDGRGEYLFLPTPLYGDNRLLGWMVLGQPADPLGQLPRLALTLVLGTAFTLIIALAGGYWLADRALRPVKTMARTAQAIEATGLNRRLEVQTRDELGELAATFNAMLDRLQAAFDRQRQFTADASHELRTPLTIIGLETDRALAAARSSEDYRRALHVIQSENAFMTHLVSELLTLARMDAGQVALKREPFDLSDLALEVAERFAALAANKGIRLQTGPLPELAVAGDRQYLSQMIANLVDNAIKYSPARDGQWVRVETAAGPDQSAEVRVIDNGPGIPAEHLPHLFNRFYRVDSARSHNVDEAGPAEQPPGSGLGLSIAQWIAHMHGGRITVESQPGQGTTFRVILPNDCRSI